MDRPAARRRRNRWRRGVVTLAVLGGLAAACSGDDGGTPAVERRPSGYVALGDSFSAGVGAAPDDAGSGGCERSTRSWPPVLDELDDAVDLVAFVACGGATVDDLLGPDGTLDAQIPAGAEDREVGLVTLTIGGNDVGFSALVARCVLLDCSNAATDPGFRADLEAVGDRLSGEVYPAIRAAYPRARIAHVGYPRLTPAPGEDVEGCRWLSPTEQTAAAAVVEQLGVTAEQAVAAAEVDDVVFVDVFEALAGHELCTDEPWVNEVITLRSGRAHPTAEGYAAIAEAVAAALG